MAAKTVDRRIQRTRALLQDALVAMIIEKGYEATTVQDIIDRANVGRSTFYAHFADKETLLASSVEDLRTFLQLKQHESRSSRDGASVEHLGFSLAMLEHAREHLALYQAIVGKDSGAFVMKRIQRAITELVQDDLGALGFKRASARRDLAAEYVAGAFMAVLTWWLDRGAERPPQEVDGIFRGLVLRGLARESDAA